MEKDFNLALALDDVLIVPQYSKVVTRKLIDLKTKFSRNISLSVPIVSANMDTVTESAMAIAMAREGGIGIIHRFMPIEQEVREVRQVKKAETLVVNDPVTVSGESTLAEVLEVMKNSGISSVLVTDKNGVLEGIITARDIRFRVDNHKKAAEIMTPKEKLITASPDVKKEDVIGIFDKYKIEKLPLIDKDGKLQGLIAAADFTKESKYRGASKDNRGRLVVGAAIGVKDGEERAEKLVEAGVDVLIIDIAHGHHQSTIDLLTTLKRKHPNTDVVAGNVATAEGVEDLIKAGADAIKIGIGPGKACSTRVVSGAGMPQFTAVWECSRAAKKYNIPVIADGGIKNSGDLAKVIGAGASTAMIGGLLAGTKESPGDYYIEDGVAYKIYRGLASKAASIDQGRSERAAEGISTTVAYKGDVAMILRTLIDGLQSGMSYSGAENIVNFWEKVKFVRITSAGFNEGLPRR